MERIFSVDVNRDVVHAADRLGLPVDAEAANSAERADVGGDEQARLLVERDGGAVGVVPAERLRGRLRQHAPVAEAGDALAVRVEQHDAPPRRRTARCGAEGDAPVGTDGEVEGFLVVARQIEPSRIALLRVGGEARVDAAVGQKAPDADRVVVVAHRGDGEAALRIDGRLGAAVAEELARAARAVGGVEGEVGVEAAGAVADDEVAARRVVREVAVLGRGDARVDFGDDLPGGVDAQEEERVVGRVDARHGRAAAGQGDHAERSLRVCGHRDLAARAERRVDRVQTRAGVETVGPVGVPAVIGARPVEAAEEADRRRVEPRQLARQRLGRADAIGVGGDADVEDRVAVGVGVLGLEPAVGRERRLARGAVAPVEHESIDGVFLRVRREDAQRHLRRCGIFQHVRREALDNQPRRGVEAGELEGVDRAAVRVAQPQGDGCGRVAVGRRKGVGVARGVDVEGDAVVVEVPLEARRLAPADPSGGDVNEVAFEHRLVRPGVADGRHADDRERVRLCPPEAVLIGRAKLDGVGALAAVGACVFVASRRGGAAGVGGAIAPVDVPFGDRVIARVDRRRDELHGHAERRNVGQLHVDLRRDVLDDGPRRGGGVGHAGQAALALVEEQQVPAVAVVGEAERLGVLDVVGARQLDRLVDEARGVHAHQSHRAACRVADGDAAVGAERADDGARVVVAIDDVVLELDVPAGAEAGVELAARREARDVGAPQPATAPAPADNVDRAVVRAQQAARGIARLAEPPLAVAGRGRVAEAAVDVAVGVDAPSDGAVDQVARPQRADDDRPVAVAQQRAHTADLVVRVRVHRAIDAKARVLLAIGGEAVERAGVEEDRRADEQLARLRPLRDLGDVEHVVQAGADVAICPEARVKAAVGPHLDQVPGELAAARSPHQQRAVGQVATATEADEGLRAGAVKGDARHAANAEARVGLAVGGDRVQDEVVA